MIDLQELKSRINPTYSHTLGTESYERRLCVEEIERLSMGLENCRLLAARHRKEDWALLILGFCAEAGIVGSTTR